MKQVCFVQANGTAAVVSPVRLAGETDQQAEARVQAATPGGELVTPELVSALRRADTPVRPRIPANIFSERLAPLAFSLATANTGLQQKWDRNLAAVSRFREIDTAHPRVVAFVQQAVSDGLLTAAEGAAVLAPE